MTQSGQGEQPSPREAREGVVLPSDGGEPLLPGRTGSYGDPPQGGYGDPSRGGHEGPAQGAPAPDGAYGPPSGGQGYGQPPGGQGWGTAWGPDQSQAQDWSQPAARTWGVPQQPGGIPPQSQPLPAQEGQSAAYGGAGAGVPQQPAAPAYNTDEPTSYYLPPVGRPLPSVPAPQSQPLPAQEGQSAAYGGAGAGVPQQPAAPAYNTDEPTSYYLPPVGRPLPSVPAPQSQPLPADDGATQYIPPVAAAPAPYEGATQYIPPVRPGALPPEVSAEAAQYPRQAPYGTQPQQNAASGAGPFQPAAPAGSDADTTQYIAPVPGHDPGAAYDGDRQPPSEFDNLFRGPGGDGGAASTQQLPRFAQPEAVPHGYGGRQPSYAAQQPPYVPPGGDGYDGYDGHGDQGGGRRSRVPVIAAVGIGIVVLGIGAGALLAGGGGGSGDGGDKNQTVSATAPASDGSASPSTDAAKTQATELDKLLADSGNSRSSVISAVANVKSCNNLPQAAEDLRNAATQRTDLVTRLKGLSVDRLPGHTELTAALTRAWQASASADNHYAAWADQAAGRKGCKKGQARATGQTAAGNRDSGTASTEKARAARLWNAIAKKYSLTERSATQL